MTHSIGFIGLGKMGALMAANLLESNIPLFVFNRSVSKAEDLVQKGASKCTAPEHMWEKTSVVITMLSNDEAVLEISMQLLETIKKDCIHISMSTISPETSRKLEKLHREKGAYYVTAPVLGRPVAAKERKLWICVAGDENAKKRVMPFLNFLGKPVDFGQDVGAANVVKACNNFLVMSAMEALAEAFWVAKNQGIDPEKLASFFSETLFACPIYKVYAPLIAKESFEDVGLKMTLALKDLRLFKEKLALPFAGALEELLEEGIAAGRGELDWSALSLSMKDSVAR